MFLNINLLITENKNFVIFCVISFSLILLLFSLSLIIKIRTPTVEKLSQYECGFQPFQSRRLPFNISYYFIALRFILFDIELVLFLPFIFISLQILTIQIYLSLLIFFILIGLSLWYEWSIGALQFII